MTLLANEWVRRGHQVQLITMDLETPFFPLASEVKLVQLGCERPSGTPVQAIWNLFRSVSMLRRSLKAFGSEVIVAFTTRINVKALIAASRLRIPVVISERTDPVGNVLSSFWRRLVDRWYPRAARLVVQTPRAADYFAQRGFALLSIIPNPIDDVPVRRTVPQGDLLWMAVARLSPEKGIDLLLQGWAASKQGKSSRLRILGDGPSRAELEAQAVSLGIADRVEFAGFVSEKALHWAQASAFVLPSRFEGFPNALCEAMAAGLACVSFDCPSGPAELIRDGENGILVPPEDISALAAAMDRVAADREFRERLGHEAVKIKDLLGLSGIVDRWEAAWRL
jgi:glycosyltransferase involved in cell wall biosynthesis